MRMFRYFNHKENKYLDRFGLCDAHIILHELPPNCTMHYDGKSPEPCAHCKNKSSLKHGGLKQQQMLFAKGNKKS